jgi:hypothetical protein
MTKYFFHMKSGEIIEIETTSVAQAWEKFYSYFPGIVEKQVLTLLGSASYREGRSVVILY